ncbi:MAG: hypothetical protein C5B43_03490 [Verrucomicrobia bacterium]|nr:MAG: hypothetical protein C5B43_03490 [Verrucomicrobiota bacterium]
MTKYLFGDGINNPNWKGGKPKCLDCGIDIGYGHKRCKVHRSIFRKNHYIPLWVNKQVPRGMLGKHHLEETKRKISLNRKGKGNKEKQWKWKGGITSENYKQRRTFQMTMKKQIFERDNYTCQLCGVRGVDLQVDHIQPWAEYVELRFKMENCRTLCAKCHYQITFGKPMSKNVKGWGHNLLKGVDLQ